MSFHLTGNCHLGSDREVVINKLQNQLFGIVAIATPFTKLTNACTENNGGCRHLCLFPPAGATCHAPDGKWAWME